MTENDFLFCLLMAFFIGVAFGALLMLIHIYRQKIKSLREPIFRTPEDFMVPRRPWPSTWAKMAEEHEREQQQPGDVGHNPQHDPGLKP